MPSRRSFGKSVLGSALLFGPAPWAWVRGQGAQGAQLLKLPKIALVIGNAAYRQSPLRNPANDAKGMADALNSMGFEVTVRLDAGRTSMLAAIDAYLKQLAGRKCVGLFYFAGHGVQINWKNHLLPVDAEVASNEDVEKQSVEVSAMLLGLSGAGNALNLIILDACRDAPFGEARRPEQRGLSQMDAPASTLLAYATAPGNVASDGEGANGLYTENLLREMRSPEARVEDVFKRVRLNVRRKSNGKQIPWESTSLEDDYYFVPPASLAPPADAARTRRFGEELKLWESIENADEPAPFENYVRRYPNGHFVDLARARQATAVALQARLREEDRQRLRAEEAAAWGRVESASVPEPLKEFLKRYPAGQFGERARAQLQRIVLQRANSPTDLTPPIPAVLTESDRERRFAEERKLWEKIENANQSGPFEDYLRRYPSGYFAELAQFQLDRALAQQGENRIVIPTQQGNPYSAGTLSTDTAFRVGDTYLYQVSDLDSGAPLSRARVTVTAITDSEIVFNNGRFTWDRLGNLRRRSDGTIEVGAQYMPTEMALGKSWVSRHDLSDPTRSAPLAYVTYQFRIVARERVVVPAGRFDCFRIEGKGVTRRYLGSRNSHHSWVRWVAPAACRDVIKSEYRSERFDNSSTSLLANQRRELVSFRQG